MKHAFTHTHTHTPTETLHTCFITSHLYLPLCAELIVLLVTHKNSLWRTSEKQHSTTPQGARVMRAHSSASLVPVLTHVNTHTHTHSCHQVYLCRPLPPLGGIFQPARAKSLAAHSLSSPA